MNAVLSFLSQPAVARVGWALVHFLWQGAGAAALLAVALLILRNRSPGARYLAACCALIAMLAAPVGTLAWPSRSAPFVAAPSAELPELPEFRGGTGAPISAGPSVALAPPIQYDRPAATATPPAPPIPWKDRAMSFIERNLHWLVAGWLSGVTLLALRLLMDFVRVQRIRRRGATPVGAALDATARRLALKLGLRRAVVLFESALAEVPIAIGWLRPVILLPASLLTRLTPAQLEAILAHELAHIRRHDYLVNLFQTVAETLLFYHPAVHWVSRRIRQERELCCDDLAVAVCGDRVAYARALAELAEHSAIPSPAAAASGGSLLARIRRLLDIQDERERPATRWLAGAAPLAILIVVLSLAISCAVPLAEKNRSPTHPVAGYAAMLKLYPEADRMRMPTAAEIQALGPLWPSFPAEENAAYYLMQAAARVSNPEKAPAGSAFLGNVRPYDGDKIAFEQWAAANQPALDAISLALRAPHSQFPVFYLANEDVPAWWEQSSLRLEIDPKTHNMLQPGDAVAVKKLTRLLTDEGFAAELDGKPDAAVAHYLTGVQISSRLRDHVTSMSDALMVEAPDKAGAVYADRVIANTSLTDETLRRVISICRSAHSPPGMLGEIVQGQAVLDKLAVQDKRFGGLAKLYLPFYEAAQKVIPGKSLTELLQPGAFGNLEADKYAYPAFRAFLAEIAQSDVQLGETEIRAALALYQRQTGRLPDSLNELVPGLLPEAPTDPFSGKPMRYARTADGWKIWSVGESGVDHGGVSNAVREALRQDSGMFYGPDYVFVSNLASNVELRSGGKLKSAPEEKPK